MQTMANKARALVAKVRQRENSKKNHGRLPATFKEGDWVFGSPLTPTCTRDKNDNPFFGPHRIVTIDESRITVRCSPRLGGTLLCAPKQLRHFHDPEDFESDEGGLKDEGVAALGQERASNSAELEDIPMEEMKKEEMEKVGYYNV